ARLYSFQLVSGRVKRVWRTETLVHQGVWQAYFTGPGGGAGSAMGERTETSKGSAARSSCSPAASWTRVAAIRPPSGSPRAGQPLASKTLHSSVNNGVMPVRHSGHGRDLAPGDRGQRTIQPQRDAIGDEAHGAVRQRELHSPRVPALEAMPVDPVVRREVPAA